MSLFKVTHIDEALRKHQELLPAGSTAQAQAWMVQLYGEALALSVVRKGAVCAG